MNQVNQLGGNNGRLCSEDKRILMVQLSAQGHRTRAIGERLKVTYSCVAKWLRRYKETGM